MSDFEVSHPGRQVATPDDARAQYLASRIEKLALRLMGVPDLSAELTEAAKMMRENAGVVALLKIERDGAQQQVQHLLATSRQPRELTDAELDALMPNVGSSYRVWIQPQVRVAQRAAIKASQEGGA